MTACHEFTIVVGHRAAMQAPVVKARKVVSAKFASTESTTGTKYNESKNIHGTKETHTVWRYERVDTWAVIWLPSHSGHGVGRCICVKICVRTVGEMLRQGGDDAMHQASSTTFHLHRYWRYENRRGKRTTWHWGLPVYRLLFLKQVSC